MPQISIIGLGLIGSSLGLALKAAKIPGVEIVGHDRYGDVASRARKLGAVDKIEGRLTSVVEKASLIIIATPVMAIKEVLTEIADKALDGCVVTDTGSTKEQVLNWADQILPARINFVGGHPMAGKETPGPEGADGKLFVNRTYCIVPSVKASTDAVKQVVGLANSVGAYPYFVDAREHDGFVAGISHLPLLLSSALVSATTSSPTWREMSRLAATGYGDISRLASHDPVMSRDICLTNKDSIARWIDVFIKELSEYRRLITQDAEDGDKLKDKFASAKDAREKWLKEASRPPDEKSVPTDIPKMSEGLSQIFFGSIAAKGLDAIRKEHEEEKKRK